MSSGFSPGPPASFSRELQHAQVPRRVDVPKTIGHPLLGERDVAVLEVLLAEAAAGEPDGLACLLVDQGIQAVSPFVLEPFDRRGDCDLPLADGRVDFHIRDPRASRHDGEINVAAQAAAGDLAPASLRRVGVAEREHDLFHRLGGDQHAQDVRLGKGKPATGVRQVQVAAGKGDLAHAAAVNEDGGRRVQALDGEDDPAAIIGPGGRKGKRELPLVPRRGDGGQPLALPTRMGEDGLAVLLHVVGNAGPAARDLEIAPIARRDHDRGPLSLWGSVRLHGPLSLWERTRLRGPLALWERVRVRALGRLPSPQAVDRDPLPRERRLALGLLDVPNRLHTRRQDGINRPLAPRGADGPQEIDSNGKRDEPMAFHATLLDRAVATRSRTTCRGAAPPSVRCGATRPDYEPTNRQPAFLRRREAAIITW